MRVMFFQMPRYYFRRDPDMGWHMALWRWRVAFQTSAQRSAVAEAVAEAMRKRSE